MKANDVLEHPGVVLTDEQRNAIEQDEKLKAFIREVTPR